MELSYEQEWPITVRAGIYDMVFEDHWITVEFKHDLHLRDWHHMSEYAQTGKSVVVRGDEEDVDFFHAYWGIKGDS